MLNMSRHAFTFFILFMSLHISQYFYLEPAVNLFIILEFPLIYSIFFPSTYVVIFLHIHPQYGKIYLALVLIGKAKELTLNSTSC